MKRLLKSKHGMTLMEILVALSLLLIIIVGTTPVMLQAYNSLYIAGEKTQETYEAKSEIEEMLATRNTRNVYPGFVVNFKNLGEVASLNGRRAVSSLYGSLETLFTNARVRVAIISSKTVNDDYSMNGKIWTQGTDNTAGAGWHEVVIQTTNLDFGTTNKYEAQGHLSINNTDNIADGGKIVDGYEKYIDITFIIPDKSTDVLERVYTYKNNEDGTRLANVDYNNIVVDPITGRITVKINGFDFTQSPIKLYVAYLDEDKKRQTTETYLEVDTPTIIAAGETGTYDYYTSPGFVQKTKSTVDASGNVVDKNVIESFGFYGREMTLKTFEHDTLTISFGPPDGEDTRSAYPEIDSGVYAIPAGTVIKSVTFIDNDETTGINPYYVFTGTNGVIYRTYSLSGANTDITKKLKGIKKNTSGSDTSAKIEIDKTLTLNGKTYYPAMWGGDVSHQFGYSTYFKSMGYQSDGDYCWYTSTFSEQYGKNGNSFENPEANSYSTKAKHSYYYNGHSTAYAYNTQNSRKISYILTEVGYSMKRGGLMDKLVDYGEFYNKIWEDYSNSKYNSTGGGTVRNDPNSWYWRESNSDGLYQQSPIYFIGGSNADAQREAGFAQLRIKYLTTNSPYTFASEKRVESSKDDSNQLNRNLWLSDTEYTSYTSQVTVTDAVYIPKTKVNGKDVGGEVFYVGTVSANAMINQNDGMYPNANQTKEEDKDWHNWTYAGYRTAYAVFGDGVNGTTVYKASYHEPEKDNAHHYDTVDAYYGFFQASSSPIKFEGKTAATYNASIYNVATSDKVNSATGNRFFVYRTSPGGLHDSMQDALTSMKLTDVYFTMGYASDRNIAYSQIVFGRVNGTITEAYKGCEPYYFKSHWGDTAGTHVPTLFMTPENGNYAKFVSTADNQKYFNSADNDYYNVWFPGEMYNLTHVATKEGVTVSVGYAVAGSTYQFLNPKQDSNSSTALGGIYNDGVLATMVGGEDSSLTNLLYYKDNVSFDNNSLTDGTAGYNYKNFNGDNYSGGDANRNGSYGLFDTKGYGSHTRDSVQFTAVDIGIQYTKVNDTSEKADYYAYYADNKGRVFRSKVATRTSTATVAGTPVKVDYISDKLYTSATLPSSDIVNGKTVGYMEQLTLPGSKQFVDLFDSITSLVVEGNMIFISGKPNQANAAEINAKGVPTVVGLIDETTGNIEWIINYSSSTVAADCWVEDLLVLDGYLYIAGRYVGTATSDRGFVAGVSVADLRSILMSGTTSIEHTVSLKCVNLPDAIYAIDGHK